MVVPDPPGIRKEQLQLENTKSLGLVALSLVVPDPTEYGIQTRLEHAKLLTLVNLRAVVPNPPRPQNAEGTALIRPFLLNLESTSPIWTLI
jgi:hypothetical protein